LIAHSLGSSRGSFHEDRVVCPGRRRELDDLPGPRGLPVLGNLHQIDSGKLHLILEGWAAQYGPTYQIRIGRRRLIVITDPKHCDQILRARPETFSRGAI
jgi:hypothetical protein